MQQLRSFSALQRAENSSTGDASIQLDDPVSFSALQRAENSSTQFARTGECGRSGFQCSSASRKFLNQPHKNRRKISKIVSVLFSEPKIPQRDRPHRPRSHAPEFQCSSASRKFLNKAPDRARNRRCGVSVLFSEPKIPQRRAASRSAARRAGFSALQRAENSSTLRHPARPARPLEVSVLFNEPKLLKSRMLVEAALVHRQSFSALQRAEIAEIEEFEGETLGACCFSALQRAEIAEIARRLRKSTRRKGFQCSSTSRNC